jgi:zinc protease
VSLGRLATVIREELQRLVSDGVATEERDRAVSGVETSFVRSLEHVGGFGGKADRLNEYHFMAGTPGWVRQDLARYRKVDAAGVVDVARRWLVDRPAVWLSVVPRGRTDLAAEGAAEGAR